MTTNAHHPFHPLIYLRGFAGTQGEIEDTAADPYMGFNLGSTKVRQAWDGSIKRFFFESPLVRLMKEHGYDDVYVDGLDQVLDERATEPIPYRSIVVHRYYEAASKTLGSGRLPTMEEFAVGLSDLVLRLKQRICSNPENKVKPADFRVNLAAHSMGGLVARAFLQNPALGSDEARRAVDKLFTYGTPHNGIDVALLGNIPGWLGVHNVDDFNRERMARYLALSKAETGRYADVGVLKGIDPGRVFNLVGTAARDYAVAGGAARTLVGELSDGLVRIENATTWGLDANGERVTSPRAFVHRSHSGHFGLVNSEEGYQNLTRFLFGDLRVDGGIEIEELTLPERVAKERAKGKTVRASYHFEVVVGVRGAQWHLHRRTVGENSAIFRRYEQIFDAQGRPLEGASTRLFSTFLDGRKRVNARRKSLGFSIELRVVVPDYEVDGFLFLDDHFEGGSLYRDRILLEVTPPEGGGKAQAADWKVRYGFESRSPLAPTEDAVLTAAPEGPNGPKGIEFAIPIEQPRAPGIKAKLRINVRRWNA